MIALENGEIVSSADHVAGIVERLGKTEYVGITKIVSIRIPLNLFIDLTALAHVSGKSRNSMISNLLEVGIEEVKSRLSPETLRDIDAVSAEQLADHLNEEA
jgi:predicted DNA-binding protein